LEGSLGYMLLLQAVLIALNAVFACAEIAVISINDGKLAKLASDGDKRAKRLVKLTNKPEKFLATIQVAITLSGFLGSAFAAENFSDMLVDWVVSLGVKVSPVTLDAVAVVLITLILSYFTLVFGELVPKRVAMRKAEKIGLALSGLVNAISVVFKPIVWFLSVSTNAMLRVVGVDPDQEEEQAGEEEIRMMVDVGSEKGTIDRTEKEFIQNVFEFDDLTADEIATHRTDVDLLWMKDTMDEWAEVIHSTRHTLYPICDESPDNIIGILNAKDYFRIDVKTRENVFADAVRAAYFVPENIKADVLFQNMKRNHESMAVVLDEYGGMVGIVTLNDLVEELVGTLNDDDDENDADSPQIVKIGEDSWKIHCNIELADIEEATGVKLDDEEYDTFTGLVFGALGVIPGDGQQSIDLEMGPLKIHISRIEGHQISEAVINVIALPGDDGEEAEDE
jgi:putative hemolysin